MATKKLKRGQQFTVILDENSSTGTSWFVVADKGVVKLVKSEMKQSESQRLAADSGMTGVPHQRVFTFEAVDSGVFEIVLRHPWETKALQVKSIEIKVEGGKPAGIEMPQLPEWYPYLSYAGMASGAYHGYKRNGGSVGWAIAWATLGSLAPFITIPVSLAQGYGKSR
jgi:predicted secreted protein